MKRIFSIALLLAATIAVWAQNGTLNPDNPPEPAQRFRLTVSADPANGATTSGSGEYTAGTVVTVKATANSNYVLTGWTKNGESYSQTATSFKFTMPAEDVQLTATFEYQEPEKPEYNPTNPAEPQVIELKYALYLVADPVGGGTFNIASGTQSKEGTELSLTATPATGYQFVGWYTAKGETLGTDATLAYTMPAKTTTLTARFIYNYNPDNPSEPTGGQEGIDNSETSFVMPADSAFTLATAEQTDMVFKVLNTVDRTCQVGTGRVPAIDQATAGSLTVPATVTLQGLDFRVIQVGSHAFSGCTGITGVTLPVSVRLIGDHAFEGCTALTAIVCPDNDFCFIDDFAFDGCTALKAVSIPKHVDVGNNPFIHCTALTSLTVSEESDYLKTIDGVLYSLDGSRLVIFPAALGMTDYSVAEGTTAIGSYAFSGSSLTTIELPATLSAIGEEAFGDVPLTEVTSNITKVFDTGDDVSVFSQATLALATLYVPAGTMEDYKKLTCWKDFANIEELFVGDPLTPRESDMDYSDNAFLYDDIDLSWTVIDNVYYNIPPDRGRFDDSGKCVVIGAATAESDMPKVTVSNLLSRTVKEKFTGLIFEVPAGKGNLAIDAQTVGGMCLTVTTGSGTPLKFETEGTFKAWVPYDVSEPAYVYVYADAKAAARTRTDDAGSPCLKVYSISMLPDNILSGDVNTDGKVNVADIVAMVNYIQGKKPEAFSKPLADVNNDVEINWLDVEEMEKIILGKQQ